MPIMEPLIELKDEDKGRSKRDKGDEEEESKKQLLVK